jgi:hypothetical protein
VVRLTGENVQADLIDRRTGKRQPRLMMPVSHKGSGKKQARSIPMPITAELADRLSALARPTGALLTRADGRSWDTVNLSHYFEGALKAMAFNNPSKVTMYALRHTSIVRQLLANVPAALHDTSVVMIERNYSKFIADHADELARAALPKPAEIVSLDGQRPAHRRYK